MELPAFLENWGVWVFGLIFVVLATKNYNEFKKLLEAKTARFNFFLVPTVLVILAPIFYASMPIFIVYRQIAKAILSLKYGSKFGGLLEGSDVVFSLENKTPIHMFYIIEYKGNGLDFYEHVMETMRKALLAKCKEEPKIFAIKQKAFGYPYLLKDEVTFEECFKKLKVVKSPTYEMTKSDLTHLVGEYSNVPLPKNRRGLWEVLVGIQPVLWKNNVQDESIKYYPVIFRAHHSIADAWHIFKGVIKLFADENIKEDVKVQAHALFKSAEKHKDIGEFLKLMTARTPDFLKLIWIKSKYYARQCLVAFMCPAALYVDMIVARSEKNILCRPVLINQKILCLNVEERPHYIQVVKRIKRKIPGTSFEDVFVTAFTASFNEYFRKHSSQIPEYLAAEIPSVPESLQAASLNPSEIKKGKLRCTNNLSGCIRKLPVGIAFGQSKTSLIETLKCITRERSIIKSSFESEVFRWAMGTAMGWYIEPINRLIVDQMCAYSTTISNIPGPSYITVMEGCPLQDIIAFPAHRNRAGLGVVILTYNQRIQLSLTVDKALISNESEVQEILDRIYDYIDLLDKEA